MNKYLAAALILLGVGLMAGSYHAGKSNEASANTSRIAKAITEANEKRGKINDTFEGISDYLLCVKLGGVREQCAELRGVGEDKP